MTTTTEAIYTNGVLKPLEPLELREQQRVRVNVRTLDMPNESARRAAMARLRARIEGMNFRSSGRFPTRDELHERR